MRDRIRSTIVFLLTFAIFWGVGYLLVTNISQAEAVSCHKHNEWGAWEYGEWSECEPVNECGPEGQMTANKTRTCQKVDGCGSDECEIDKVWVCDYFWKVCWSGHWEYYPETQEEQVYEACTLEKYVPCEEPQPEPTPTPEPEGEPEPAPPLWKPAEYHPPSCDNIDDTPKPPIVTGGYRVDEDTVMFQWIPSTDPVDFQLIKYGVTPDNLNMGIPELPNDSHEMPVDFLYGMDWWFQTCASRNNCVSCSELIMN